LSKYNAQEAEPERQVAERAAPAMEERARVAAASAAERAACEARYAAACAAAAAAGAPAPFRGPAADSPLGERFLDVIAFVSANGFALDARPTRFVCGLTFRLGARRADGSVDRAGFRGGAADMIDCALRLQAPWLEEARGAPRECARAPGYYGVSERTTSLMRAALSGDERRVRELLAAGAPLRCVDGSWQRRTALHWATLQGDARIAAALLEADTVGSTVDAQDSMGETPLMLASQAGREGAVRALLARGARQELKDNARATALHHAARSGHAGIVELLCAAPFAPVDVHDGNSCTPLIEASTLGHEGAVRALLARGARQELRGRFGTTALHCAASNSRTAVVELLCAAPGAPVNVHDGDRHTPLSLASFGGSEGSVRALLACGAQLELQISGGRTALHCAVRQGHAGVVAQLCAAPGAAALIAVRDNCNRTPLALAVEEGQAACAAVLRAHGAS
jgi:ankyrin repeat protein